MAIQKLFPVDLFGQGILNSIELGGGGGTETTVNLDASNQYTYFFSTEDGQTDWNTVVNAASSPNVNSFQPLGAGFVTGRGSDAYVNGRVMGEFRLDGIPGTITKIIAGISTIATFGGAFDVNIYDAGTTGLTGVGGEYSYYKDAGSTAFSTAQTISADTTYNYTLNSSALTIANTKPAAFVIAAIHDFDYTPTAPVAGSVSSIIILKLKVTYVS